MAPHPTAVATEGHIRKLKRSSSFGDALKRILPSNRPERGYTLREQYRMSEDSSQDHVKSMFGGMSVAGRSATLTLENTGKEKKQPGAIRRLIRSLGSLKKKNEKLDAKSIINNSGDEQRAPRGMNVANGPAATLSGMNVPNGPATLTSESKSKSKPAAVEKTPAEERRRFRRSEDYLGVQGANPTTGTWDSDPSSTTEQMSEETQKRVDDYVKVLVEAKKRVEAAQKLEQEAQKRFQDTLQKVQALRAVKKEEKEQEKLVKKMSRRRRGRWRLTETGWRSTELSPIAQSPATPLSAAPSPFNDSRPPLTPVNVGSSESEHTVIHKSSSFLEEGLSLASSTNIYITTIIITGCAQQQQQLQRGGGEDIVGLLNELMKTRIGRMGFLFCFFLIVAFNFFDNARTALSVSGIFTFEMVALAFF